MSVKDVSNDKLVVTARFLKCINSIRIDLTVSWPEGSKMAPQALLCLGQQCLLRPAQQALTNWPTICKFAT